VDLNTFLKECRKLAHRQFFAKMLLRKINATLMQKESEQGMRQGMGQGQGQGQQYNQQQQPQYNNLYNNIQQQGQQGQGPGQVNIPPNIY
jgi:hypothetical protein